MTHYNSLNVKLSNSQPLRPLTKIDSPFLKKSAKTLTKKVLAPVGLTAVMSAIDGSIKKKMHGSGHNTTLIISNDEMEDILKIVKSLEDSELLLEGVSETIKMKQKNKKQDFLVCY